MQTRRKKTGMEVARRICSQNAASVPVRPHGENMTAMGTEPETEQNWDITNWMRPSVTRQGSIFWGKASGSSFFFPFLSFRVVVFLALDGFSVDSVFPLSFCLSAIRHPYSYCPPLFSGPGHLGWLDNEWLASPILHMQPILPISGRLCPCLAPSLALLWPTAQSKRGESHPFMLTCHNSTAADQRPSRYSRALYI